MPITTAICKVPQTCFNHAGRRLRPIAQQRRGIRRRRRDKTLLLALRRHANFVEYVPFTLILNCIAGTQLRSIGSDTFIRRCFGAGARFTLSAFKQTK